MMSYNLLVNNWIVLGLFRRLTIDHGYLQVLEKCWE